MIHQLHILSIMRYLIWNCASSYREPKKFLGSAKTLYPITTHPTQKGSTPLQPNKVHRPHNKRPMQVSPRLRQPHLHLQSTSKAKTTLKEERNKYAVAFPYWLEKNPWLTSHPARFDFQRRKKDRLVFDGSFLETLSSTYTNKIASTTEEIQPHWRLATNRHLVQIFNIRIYYPDKEITLFDDDASGSLLHSKLHP